MGNNIVHSVFTFHENETSVVDGNIFNVNVNSVMMNIAISGDSDDAIVVFEGTSNNDEIYTAIGCVDLSDYSYGSTTDKVGSVWQMSLEAWIKIRVRIYYITNGSITVRGTIVN